MPFSPRRLLRRLRSMLPSAAPAAAAAGEDEEEGERRPWEPPFDASQPAPPISYPITTLAALASRAYLSEAGNFHLPFNRASSSPRATPIPPRRRILACHDFRGGYRDDAAPQGGHDPGAYALWHWHLIDVFVYFSHYLVTLPPPCWVNAAHLHGVKVCAPPPQSPASWEFLLLRLSGSGSVLASARLTFVSAWRSVSEGFGDVHHRVG